MMGTRICVIEDDDGIQEILKIILHRAGYEISVLSDGTGVLENDHTPADLYLVDKQLHGFDGLNICEYLKLNEATRAIPVLMMSADPGVAQLAFNAGADGFIEKPFTMQALLRTIQAHLNKQEADKITC